MLIHKIRQPEQTLFVFTITLILLTSCSGGSGPTNSNRPPQAVISGESTVITGEAVQLNGFDSSDPNGSLLTYQWSIQSAPSNSTATLDHATTPVPSMIADFDGIYVFQLVVSDGAALSSPASFTVTSSSLTNQPPVIESFSTLADIPQSEINETVTFSWEIFDVNNDELTCEFDAIGNYRDVITITNCPNSGSHSFTFENYGEFKPRLLVTDSTGQRTEIRRSHNVPNSDFSINVLTPLQGRDYLPPTPVANDGAVLFAVQIDPSVETGFANAVARVADSETELGPETFFACEIGAGGVCNWYDGNTGFVDLAGFDNGDYSLEIIVTDLAGTSYLVVLHILLYEPEPSIAKIPETDHFSWTITSASVSQSSSGRQISATAKALANPL